MNKKTLYKYCDVCKRTLRKTNYNENNGVCGVCHMEVNNVSHFKKYIKWLSLADNNIWFTTKQYSVFSDVSLRASHHRLNKMHDNGFVIKQLRHNVGAFGRACFWKINEKRLSSVKERFNNDKNTL